MAPTKVTKVHLPDVFQSFARSPPKLNPHYASVKQESEDWLSDLCDNSPKMRTTITRCDFSYFIAIAAPDAPRERFRTLCDWGNWVFPYDDVFDNGELRDQPERAKLVMGSLMAIMLGQVDEDAAPEGLRKLPIIQAHDSVYRRMAVSGPGVRKRFAQTMNKYCTGALTHVSDYALNQEPTLADMVQSRRDSGGVSPIYHLVEYAHDLSVPDEVFQSHLVLELEVLGIDLVTISNDMLSYSKEERDGVPHNMIAACRLQGLSVQQAFDTVSELLMDRYRRWDEVEAELQAVSWADESTRQQALLYVQGIQNTVTANMYWSFKSGRYFGSASESIRVSRQIEVMLQPPYLISHRQAKQLDDFKSMKGNKDNEIIQAA